MSDSQLLLASNEAASASHTIAQHTEQKEHAAPAQHSAPASAPAHAPAHGGDAHAAASHDVPPSEVFTHLLSELSDHHGFVWFDKHLLDLPVILVDEGKADFYGSEHSMEAAGKYTMLKGHVVKKADMKPPQWDLSITNYVFFEWIAMALVLLLVRFAVGRYKKNPTKAPSGVQNALEAVVLYLRDEVVYANIPSRKAAERLLPYFLSTFFFILTLNFLGFLPGGHAATGSLSVTAALAFTAFLMINVTQIRESGIGAYLSHLTGGAPWALWPIMIPIEILGIFTKPFALAMRLFANMSAGHMVLLVLMGLIFFFKSWAVAPASVGFSVFIYFLELLVMFLQAFIFTMLVAVFTGLGIGDHGHEHH
jgi:F-type H+-transporting ATPase subunit a